MHCCSRVESLSSLLTLTLCHDKNWIILLVSAKPKPSCIRGRVRASSCVGKGDVQAGEKKLLQEQKMSQGEDRSQQVVDPWVCSPRQQTLHTEPLSSGLAGN